MIHMNPDIHGPILVPMRYVGKWAATQKWHCGSSHPVGFGDEVQYSNKSHRCVLS